MRCLYSSFVSMRELNGDSGRDKSSEVDVPAQAPRGCHLRVSKSMLKRRWIG